MVDGQEWEDHRWFEGVSTAPSPPVTGRPVPPEPEMVRLEVGGEGRGEVEHQVGEEGEGIKCDNQPQSENVFCRQSTAAPVEMTPEVFVASFRSMEYFTVEGSKFYTAEMAP